MRSTRAQADSDKYSQYVTHVLLSDERIRLIEDEVAKLGGIKSLCAESFYTQEAFDRQYGGSDYRALKARYDPDHRLKDLYQKCVLRQ